MREEDVGMGEDSMQHRAVACVLDQRLDEQLSATVARLSPDELAALPWLLCYAAMQQRLMTTPSTHTLRLALAAQQAFAHQGDVDGQVRALAEVGIIRYQLGQRTTALAELQASPVPRQPACAAALALARFVNALGVDDLPLAIRVVQDGLRALDHEASPQRQAQWRVVLQRNVLAAYHFNGRLADARATAQHTLQIVAEYELEPLTVARTLYETGLLEQRAGGFDQALDRLHQARTLIEEHALSHMLWRWVVAAQGRTLRDMNELDQAAARFREGGWGEGDEGPVWLWVRQARLHDARAAIEAQQRAALALDSPSELANTEVFAALLDLEAGATPLVVQRLRAALDEYARLDFWHTHASVQFHLATVLQALGHQAAGDEALTAALQFGARQGYFNFHWWHPSRMRQLLHYAVEAGIESTYSARLLQERGLELHDADLPQIDAARVPQSLVIRCFGKFEVEIDGTLLPPARWQGHAAGPQRMQRLLLLLARFRAPQPVDVIARYVWPDSFDHIDMANNVHVTLSGLRRVLEPDLPAASRSHIVLTTPGGYQLHPAISVDVDLHTLDTERQRASTAAAQDDQATVRVANERIEQLYAGAFALARTHPSEAETYLALAMDAVRWLARDDLAQQQIDAALARAQRLVQENHWDNEGWQLLIQAYLAQNNRRAARRQYQRYLKLQNEPDEAVVQLARKHRLL